MSSYAIPTNNIAKTANDQTIQHQLPSQHLGVRAYSSVDNRQLIRP
jgi:hypothetical protein